MQCSDTLQIIAALTLINACTCSNNQDTFNERTSSQTYYADSVYRNLDTQLLRIGSRLDQLMIRMDHLDSRVGRVQSTGHLRFDSIETSMQTTRQRLDLWSNQLNLVEEQLSRKWKNMENRFDSLVSTMDSKLDTKFNLIQRDNRRHNEFISQAFNSVIISQEKLSDRLGHSINQMNSTLLSTQSIVNVSASAAKSHSSTCLARLDTLYQNLTSPSDDHQSPNQHQTRRSNTIQPTDHQLQLSRSLYSSYPSSSVHHQQQNSTAQLISTKVSNMFEELVKRSHDLEAIVKDTFTMSNMTRREVQDGFMALIPIVSQVGLGNEKSSSGEVMSGMVVEALSTVEQLSTSLGRRMAELNRSINERFEMVSMTLNGFLESCLRIQERAPQLEREIGDVLWKILDSVDNSTRNATETWQRVSTMMSLSKINVTNCTENLAKLSSSSSVSPASDRNDTAWDMLFREYESQALEDNEYENNSNNNVGAPRQEDLIEGSNLSEEQKKLLWESLRIGGGGEESHVPE